MRPMLVSWRPRSEMGRNLAAELDAEYSHNESANHPTKGQVVVNWGCGGDYFPFETKGLKILNHPKAVALAVSKIATFRALQRAKLPIPHWTHDYRIAGKWWKEGHVVYARGDVEGNSGRGITIFDPKKGNPPLLEGYPLFTRQFKSTQDYRAFVFNGKVDRIYSVEHDEEEKIHDPYVRNYKRGWCFYDFEKNDFTRKSLTTLAKAVTVLGLDFGAVDFGEGRPDEICIYEINSAPGGEYEDAELNAKALRREFKIPRK